MFLFRTFLGSPFLDELDSRLLHSIEIRIQPFSLARIIHEPEWVEVMDIRG